MGDYHYLMIPLWELYNSDSKNSVVFDSRAASKFTVAVDLETRLNIYEKLIWAEQNPNFNFLELLKKAPVQGKLKYSNKELFIYLMSFKEFMEHEDYELLTKV